MIGRLPCIRRGRPPCRPCCCVARRRVAWRLKPRLNGLTATKSACADWAHGGPNPRRRVSWRRSAIQPRFQPPAGLLRDDAVVALLAGAQQERAVGQRGGGDALVG